MTRRRNEPVNGPAFLKHPAPICGRLLL